MSTGWYFGKASPDQKAREPQVEKFFGSDVVANLANALVREGVQNSLDARDDDRLAPSDPVVIHIHVGEIVEPGKIEAYTAGLWQHLEAQDDEHLPARPTAALPCQFLAFEDFNTRGLCGNTEQMWPDEDPGNAFFNFFRAEGHSEKRADARGRHGLGKHVFARASRARCFFGLTRQSDTGRQLLMGASVLRMHRIGMTRYAPDGWFGIQREADGFVLPVEEPEVIAPFVEAFGLARNDAGGVSGLSVVVPWLDPSIGRDDVLDAVLRGYFHPILAGQLIVTITGPAGRIDVDAAKIRGHVNGRGPELRRELEPLLDLAEFSLRVQPDEFIKANAPPAKPAWGAGLLPDAGKAKLRDDLQAAKKVALRVPVKVKSKKAPDASESYFDIFMARDPDQADGQVVFVREGLIISDARPRATPGYRALVVINEGPLATFLGDAENPAHTQWQKSQVEGKYTYPEDRIRFVVQSVPQVLRLLSADQQTPDPSVWLDLFSIPADRPEVPQPRPGPRPGPVPPPPVVPPPPQKPRRYRIDKMPGGFVLRPGAPGAERPYAVFIRVAYDTWGGDPFKGYSEDDFELDRPPIRIDERRGVQVTVGPKKNEMLVRVTEDDFELAVDGFGTSRDVITDPRLIPPPSPDGEAEAGEPTQEGSEAGEGAEEPEEVLHADPA